jgi:hypothetical protein
LSDSCPQRLEWKVWKCESSMRTLSVCHVRLDRCSWSAWLVTMTFDFSTPIPRPTRIFIAKNAWWKFRIRILIDEDSKIV